MGLWEQELMEGFIAYEKNTINSSTRPLLLLQESQTNAARIIFRLRQT